MVDLIAMLSKITVCQLIYLLGLCWLSITLKNMLVRSYFAATHYSKELVLKKIDSREHRMQMDLLLQ